MTLVSVPRAYNTKIRKGFRRPGTKRAGQGHGHVRSSATVPLTLQRPEEQRAVSSKRALMRVPRKATGPSACTRYRCALRVTPPRKPADLIVFSVWWRFFLPARFIKRRRQSALMSEHPPSLEGLYRVRFGRRLEPNVSSPVTGPFFAPLMPSRTLTRGVVASGWGRL